MAGLVSLAALEGRWRLARRIVHADGSAAALEGTAVFRRAGLRLIQEEEGWLRLPPGGTPLRATRRYLWAAETGRLEVLFEDNRPFHTVPLGVARPATVFLCDPDPAEAIRAVGDRIVVVTIHRHQGGQRCP